VLIWRICKTAGRLSNSQHTAPHRFTRCARRL
jgi:hypothetical protein